MLKIVESTVFNVNAECYVNTVNCVGVMGKGIALEFALRYPKLAEQYKKQCQNKEIKIGNIYLYNIDGQKILNFPTKIDYKYPSQIEWIEQGLKAFCEKYKTMNIKSIAFPLLGANNGGLNKDLVIELMEKYLSKVDLEVYICKSTLLEGKELEMVTKFNKTSLEEVKKQIKLNSKQELALIGIKGNLNRFSDLLKLESIGFETYRKIFNLFYFNSESLCEGQMYLF